MSQLVAEIRQLMCSTCMSTEDLRLDVASSQAADPGMEEAQRPAKHLPYPGPACTAVNSRWMVRSVRIIVPGEKHAAPKK